MILDKAKIKGLKMIIKPVKIEIWIQTETALKKRLAPTHIATKIATPKAI